MKKRKFLSKKQKDFAARLYQKGLRSSPQLARQFDVSEPTIHRLLKARNIKIKGVRFFRKGKRPPNSILTRRQEKSICINYKKGMSCRTLAKDFGLTKSGIMACLRRNKEPRRQGGYAYHTGARYLSKSGYIIVTPRPEERYLNSRKDKNYPMAEHRLIMARYLKRPLFEHERIHHKNGNRTDNRLVNLELWSISQPPGQRVKDKVKWAKEILRLYAK